MDFPAICASVLCSCCPCPEMLALLGSGIAVVVSLLFFWTFPSLSTTSTLSVFPLEKGLHLYREMDLMVGRKQVASHLYIL